MEPVSLLLVRDVSAGDVLRAEIIRRLFPALKRDGVKLSNLEDRKAFTTEPTESTERKKWCSSVLLCAPSVLFVGSVVKVFRLRLS